MSDTTAMKSPRTATRVVTSIIVCILLIGGAAIGSYVIFASEPEAQRESATRRSAALVDTIDVTTGTYRPRLEVLGVVEPAREVTLSPRLSGEVIAVEPEFTPGGVVDAGQVLLRIDPADFERALTERRSAVRQVEAELAIEEGRQQVARHEFELLGEEIDPANRALVLREPQIEAIRARLQAAEAAVEQAELDLSRTTVSAPFDAHILSRSVNIGSQVAPGDPLALVVGVDEYWVIASVPVRDLRWLRFPGDGDPGSSAHVRHTTAWEPGVFREGRVARLIGSVDQQTRLARVLVTVRDPLARNVDGPPMILGTIVRVEIEGRPVENVVRIDRDHLRQNETVWVMTDGALDIREVDVAYRDSSHAYIRAGVEDGERIVITNLATVAEGLELRDAETSATADLDGPETAR